ncbi:MAG: DNA-binding response regulator [Gammaproteobacteria bacterium RIFOXYA12_FULL_61_12]|nr:MAG: DNA-binding response regulator [Gammaproteobacteria bacterium RIFOXYD12_FULL_61_37]OGT92812.1 MAG: DNA-binding response regulator [Gammaproteobacteria bacterium RIFOXYA12_FULL_61_12]
MRVLLVEDDELLGSAVQAGLVQAGYTVDWVHDGVDAAQSLTFDGHDLLVLDLGLPRKDGLTVLRELRQRGSDLPVLILTARDAVEDRVRGLDLGADDYLIKPFDLDELTARLRAIGRRRAGRSSLSIRHGNLEFDPAARNLTLDGEAVPLHAKAIAILEALLECRGRALTREQLEQMLYGWGEGVESNTVEVYIHHLRKQLGKELIHTIRGVGYMIPKEK